MRTRSKVAVIGAGVASLTLAVAGSAFGHGYSDAPTSRQSHCAAGTATDCGQIQWEPQSVEGPKGFPGAGPEDGKICSAGNASFAELDDPRGGEWPATDLTAGQGFTFTWKITAAHSTSDFQYFITKDGYDPAKPLTRADLEAEPFVSVPMDGQKPDAVTSHDGNMPAGKSGKHMIVGVWNIADTANAFYSCADVQFN